MDKTSNHKSSSVSQSPVLLLVLALFLMVVGSWLAFIQKPRFDVFAPVSLADRFLYPNEQNAFQRLPKISSDLNDVFALPDSDLLWVVGNDGLILHSNDGGINWQQQYPIKQAEQKAKTSTQSQLDWLVQPVFAGEEQDLFSNKSIVPLKTKQPTSRKSSKPKQKSVTSKETNKQQEQPSKDIVNQTLNEQSQAVKPAQNLVHLNSIFFIDAQHGWAVGTNGTILVTGDGGKNWQTQNSKTGASLNSVHFIDGDHGWAVGEAGKILATEDGGKNWQTQDSKTGASLNSVHFIDDVHGWAVGPVWKILATSDGGMNWQAQDSKFGGNLYSVHFIDGDHGWAVGEVGMILATEDGGKNWQRQDNKTEGSLYSVHFIDGGRGWAVGFVGTILTTVDGGNSWQEQNRETPKVLYSVHFIDNDRGWAVGAGGMILVTRDGGKSWQAQSKRIINLFWSVHFDDDDRGWAVGESSIIAATRDEGESWQLKKGEAFSYRKSVHFIDGDQGWMIGDFGKILTTHDGGESWQVQRGGGDLDSVYFIDGDRGWAVGSNILSTRDGGESWQKQSSGTRGWLRDVHFIDRERGWVVGHHGTILATGDGGKSWKEQSSGIKGDLNSVYFIGGDRGWAVGDNGTILTTGDGGGSWQEQNSGSKGWLGDVHFIDRERGWVVGHRGTILASGDGGKSWQKQSSETVENLTSVHFIDAGRGWAVGENGTILATSDGGQTWLKPQYKKSPAGWFYLLIVIIAIFCWKAYQLPQQQIETKESITDLMASDRPLKKGDPDPLGFSEIARGLSRFLRNPQTEPPLTIAVTGEWGSGKSSLMNLLYQDIQDKGFSTVWFNAWHHQKSEQLLASLFANIRTQAIPSWTQFSGLWPVGLAFRCRLLKLRSQKHWLVLLSLIFVIAVFSTFLSSDNGKLHDIYVWLHHQVGILIAKMNIITKIFTTLATATAIFFGLGKSMQGFALNPLRLMTVNAQDGQSVATVDPGARYQFAQEFKDVTQSLDLGRMIIFIDDLDRCGKDNVLEVLEAINFLVSSGNCYIILGMAPEWVKICVGLGFKELAEESYAELNNGQQNAPVEHRRQFASQYLEKMINIEVPVPVLDEHKAQLLTVPEVKQVELSAYDHWVQPMLHIFRPYRTIALIMVVVAAGIGLGKSGWLNFTVPEKKKDPELIKQWVADDLQWLQNEQGEPFIAQAKKIEAANGLPVQNKTNLQWQLKAEPDVLKEGVMVQQFADGKLTLFLKEEVTEPKIIGNNGETGSGSGTNIEPSTPVIAPENSGGFEPGQTSPPSWHRFLPEFSLLPIVFVAMFLFFRKQDRVVNDSKTFLDAMALWQPYLMISQQSPRKIKRFLNHMRYLAMRYRDDDEPISLWQKWHKEETLKSDEKETFSESSLVALSMLYFLYPRWVENEQSFAKINELKINEVTAGLSFIDSVEETKLITQLEETVRQHFQMFNVDMLATPRQRELFLKAKGLNLD